MVTKPSPKQGRHFRPTRVGCLRGPRTVALEIRAALWLPLRQGVKVEAREMDTKTCKRNMLLATLALTLLCTDETATVAQTTQLTQPVHNRQGQDRRAVVVHIRNGPVIRGRLLEADTDSIRLEVEDMSCPITLEARDVARIVFAPAEVSKELAQKAVPANSPKQFYRSKPGFGVNQNGRARRRERDRRRASRRSHL